MDFKNTQIILASQSPRRKELLSLIADNFEIIPADIDESLPENTDVFSAAEILATKKAEYIAKDNPDKLVIGCDTVVICEGKILGKPKNEADAFEMLSLLSGKAHKVLSGVCLCKNGKARSFTQSSDVYFYLLTEAEINEYIATRDPFDKAGSYGIQTQGYFMVEKIDGDYNNIVGLPIARLRREIISFLGGEE